MPMKRVENGKIVSERGTKQPTTEQSMAAKQKEVMQQNKQREELEKSRKPSAAESPAPSKAGANR